MKTLKSILASVLVIVLFVGIVFAQQTTGKDIFLSSKCNTCHAISSQGVETKAGDKYPDLKNLYEKKFTPDFLKKYLNKEADLGASGKKHPIKFKGTDEEFNQLVGWLSTLDAPKQ